MRCIAKIQPWVGSAEKGMLWGPTFFCVKPEPVPKRNIRGLSKLDMK
ncbi:hypothetical protein CHCC14527_1053 [Bacillus paralicheniformis]|nr:hypothetical protein CHCC5021_0653 [Bacillus paralicheniformis]TWN28112.1 hypothetical protein CHCC14527_1053 [Bacillus paralicheniformis]